ncbi:helix-turn-helix domain-containing protein [Longirhabdus pacifica]|uniref:helix-turn-helix domain-containing protein n=1 Tax=Longirhabdus pacifica TaxID=2305227 RepID=UPI001008F360|nr:helix-turn-helix domain-containing protein [Longirhabdus pacifica]
MEYIELMQEVIDYIEQHLDEQLSVDDICQYSGYSKYHFQRLFYAVTGETIGHYMMNRRLTEAATLLLESNKSVVSIAMDTGFQSHEVFTRAFQRNFHKSPSSFRKSGSLSKYFTKYPIQLSYLYNKQHHLLDKVDEVYMEQKEVWGMTVQSKDQSDIRQCWKQFGDRMKVEKDSETLPRYGIIQYPNEFKLELEFEYTAGVSQPLQTRANDTLSSVTVPGSKYVVFYHRGSVADILHSYPYIYGAFIPSSNYILNHTYNIEVYGPNWSEHKGSHDVIQLLIPVQSK